MTDLPYLAPRLYGTPFLIARVKLEAILGVMARKMAGDRPTMPDGKDAASLQILEEITVLPILGTLVRRSSSLHAASGLTSYFEIETMAGGVFDLVQRLRGLAWKSGKPLWAIADEAALSAAYALAATDQLWLTRTGEVGSISLVAVLVDVSDADAKAGLNYSFLHAGAHKIDGHPHALLPEAVAADIKADIDRLHDPFIASPPTSDACRPRPCARPKPVFGGSWPN